MIHDPTAAAPKATKQANPPMAYKFRLYPSPAATLLMDRYAAAERTIYNLAVEYQRQLGELEAQRRRLGGRMSWPDAALDYDDVNTWAAAEAPWLRDIPGSARAQAVLITRRALLDSFLVKGREAPRFRRRHGGTNGFSWQASRASGGDVRKISKRWHEVRLPVARGATAVWCRVRVDAGRRPPPAAYRAGKVLRITRDATGTWWLTMTAPAAPTPAAPEASSCGIDVGVANTLTLADHTGRVLHINMPHLLSSAESNRLRRLQQAQDRTRRTIPCRGPCPHTAGGCWKTSNRYQHRRGEIASLRRRDRRRAHNWTEKVTTNIANRYRLVAVENLSVRAMTASAAGTAEAPGRNVAAKRGLNRSILQQRWATIICRLDEKITARGGQLVRVPAPNTSRRCHACAHTAAANRKTQAIFACTACGHTDGADANAAHNIHQLALQEHPPARGGPANEPASAPMAATDAEDRR